jgi:hypothetical protein
MKEPHEVSKDNLIYLNPKTKIGKEVYVRWDDQGNGWCFTHGQSWINLKFHSDVNSAISDMKDYAHLHGIVPHIPNGLYVVIP